MNKTNLEKKRLEYVTKARACTSLDEWELYDQQVKHYTERLRRLAFLKS
ncbi:MAG: hypothetical protein GY823_07590 [Flavobacteriaceae bacterium]|nr:hypothetical protein [Flavobacteriaceae bacterium]